MAARRIVAQPCATEAARLSVQPPEPRDAYRAYWLTTAHHRFWGAAGHIELFLEQLRSAAPAANITSPILIDVGAAPYNTVGGDISHTWAYYRLWGCGASAEDASERRGAILGFEPMRSPFSRLVQSFKARLPKELSLRGTGDGADVEVVDSNGRVCMALRNRPVSAVRTEVQISNQRAAGDNTASLERYYHGGKGRPTRTVTLDEELAGRRAWRSGRSDVLVLKADVEGHELSVLRGAMGAIKAGRVHVILLEYGDKTSPAIWDAMKGRFRSVPAGPTPAQIPGASLYSTQRWADELGCARPAEWWPPRTGATGECAAGACVNAS